MDKKQLIAAIRQLLDEMDDQTECEHSDMDISYDTCESCGYPFNYVAECYCGYVEHGRYCYNHKYDCELRVKNQ